MNTLERRLDKLEEVFGLAGCTCNAVPALIIVRKGADPTPPEAERCPVHGFELPRLVVILRSVEDVCQQRPPQSTESQEQRNVGFK